MWQTYDRVHRNQIGSGSGIYSAPISNKFQWRFQSIQASPHYVNVCVINRKSYPDLTSLNSLSVRKLLDLSCPYFACICLPFLSLLCLHLLTLAFTLLGLTGPSWALLDTGPTGPYFTASLKLGYNYFHRQTWAQSKRVENHIWRPGSVESKIFVEGNSTF